MARDKKIEIQKYDSKNKKWNKYYSPHAEINKTSGKEYFARGTDVTKNPFNFDILYHEKLKDLIFDTASYRIIYKSLVFDIKVVDDYKLQHIKLIIVGEANGKRI